MLRDWGQESKYNHVLKGYNYRMDAFQGAILRVKLRYLDDWTERRRAHALNYRTMLEDGDVQLPLETAGVRHVYHVYAIRARERDGLQRRLHDQGIQTGIHYPVPVHLQPAYADLGCGVGTFPHAEAAAQETLSLPMFPELTQEQQSRVASAVRLNYGDL
jgi:dTDP-4-amino-4,6-dideoxygalactose transaminase